MSNSTRWSGILAVLGADPDSDTTDGRAILAIRVNEADAPWPLEDEHGGPVIGEIQKAWVDGNLLRGEGVLYTDSEDEATRDRARRVRDELDGENGQPVRGVSVQLAEETVEVRVRKEVFDEWQAWMTGEGADEVTEGAEADEDGRITVERFRFDDTLEVVTDSLLRAAAVVNVAAFNQAKIALAAAISLKPVNTAAFANPQFGATGDEDPRLHWQKPQRPEEGPGGWGAPFTVLDDGSFYGHAALRFRCHGSFTHCVPPPAQDTSLERLLTKDATGTGIPTGVLAIGRQAWAEAHGVQNGKVTHAWMSNGNIAVGDYSAGWDQHGLWIAGQLRPGLTEREIATVRGGGLSVELHPVGGRLQYIGILAGVPAEGYVTSRNRPEAVAAAIELGQPLYLEGATCCGSEGPTLEDRLAMLERFMAKQLLRGV